MKSSTLAAALAAAACSPGCSPGSSSGGSSAHPTSPLVTITAPIAGATLEGTTVLSATVLGSLGVRELQFQIDGVDFGPKLKKAPWRVQWDTATIGDGAHVISATAVDQSFQVGSSAPVAVSLQNGASDPTIDFATFLGGNDHDSIRDVFVDPLGYVYVTGGTASPNLPTTAGAYDRTFNGTHDAFVACFQPDGGALVFSTYLGGPNYERAYAIEVDDQGYIYLGGRAGDGFPTTPGCYQPTFGGDDEPSALYGEQDAFVAKLKPDASGLVWATYFGDGGPSALRDIDVDGSGNVYLATATDRDHPAVTAGAFDTTFNGPTDGLVAEISADGSSLVWCSFFGGTGPDGGTPSIRVADDGTAWVLGHSQSDDFPTTPGACQRTRAGDVELAIMRIAPGGGRLEWATYFGGTGIEFSETHGLCVDAAEEVIIAATTQSADLPSVNDPIPTPFQSVFGGAGGSGTGANTNYPGDGFIARLAADGKSLLAFTYFGGKVGEGVEGVAIDDDGNVFASGATYSTDFPVTADAVQLAKDQNADAFLVKFSKDLSTLEFATFYGGSDDDIGRAVAIEADGTAIAVGNTYSSDFPSTPAAFDPSFDGGSHDGFAFEVLR